MSEEQNGATVRRFVDEAMNKKNLDVGDDLLTADVIFHTPSGEALEGIEGWKRYAGMFITAFPDLDFKVEDTIAGSSKVVLRWVGTGTHRGNLRSIPPSGKQVSFPGVAIYRLEGDKIAEMWGMIDMLGLMQQIGAIPSPS